MKKFIVIYHAPKGAMDKMANVSPQDAKKGMEPWMAWAKRIGSGMVDFGTPLGNGQKVTKSGTQPSDKNVWRPSLGGAPKLGRGCPGPNAALTKLSSFFAVFSW